MHLVRTNALGEPEQKEFVKFFRMEANVVATPSLALGMTALYLPTGSEIFALAVGASISLLGNFLFNHANDKLDMEVTPLGVIACVPVVGALVPKHRRLDADSKYTFVQPRVFAEQKTLRDFLNTNEEVEESWDKLFQQETRTDAYSYIARNVVTDFLGIGSHAYQVGQIMRSFGSWGKPIMPCRTEQMVCRKKISMARSKGEYVPIHWELIAYPRSVDLYAKYED